MGLYTALYATLRPLLFTLPPELAHRLTIRSLQIAARFPDQASDDYVLSQNVLGLNFANPFGMAAGFDKDGEAMTGIGKIGFGFTEIGTLTPLAQRGNPAPRVFRLPRAAALINRLGFNNQGQIEALHRLEVYRANPAHRAGPVIGVNIGTNKDAVDRIADYETGAARFAGLADYLTINVSSPNTPGLRDLQGATPISEIMQRVRAVAPNVPVMVKIAPDMKVAQAQEIASLALKHKIAGLIIANTTLTRDGVSGHKYAGETGGLSGQPLFEVSTRLLGEVYQIGKDQLTLIGVGGVASAEQAYAKICAGASLVQLYTGLVYNGPGLVVQLKRGLAERLRVDGFINIAAAVGSDYR